MICISRRSARSSDVPIDLTSRPSNLTSPDVGSMSRRIVRPVVVLPQPDSPTPPTRPHLPGEDSLLDWELFPEILDGNQRLGVVHAAATPSSTTSGGCG